MLGVTTDFVAFAGKTNVYFRNFSSGNGSQEKNNGATVESSVIHPPIISFTEEWKDKKCYIECIALSADGQKLAVADSLHGLHLFANEAAPDKNVIWKLVHVGNSSKRTIKLQFTDEGEYLTFLDKQGDIFAIRSSDDYQQSNIMKKIMGHTSFISDYVTRAATNQIVSCDRDEKIRISNFPDAFTIQGFKLGHTESVINLALFPRHGYLMSVSLYGVLILWDLNEEVSGTSTNFMKKWNLKEVLQEAADLETTSMKAVSTEADIFLSLTLTGSTKVNIFRIDIPTLTLSKLHSLEVESDYILMEWALQRNQVCLVLSTPLLGTMKLWNSTSEALVPFSNFPVAMIEDIKEMGEIHKPVVVPMKKRQTTFENCLPAYKETQMSKS